MSRADSLKWDEKYRDAEPVQAVAPDATLLRYADRLPLSGNALDLACGKGKNTLFLAQQGFDVLALDGSAEGLKLLHHAADEHGLSSNIETLHADLDDYQLPRESFDLIVVVRYLNRDLFASLEAALKPGGILYYQTFNAAIRDSRPGFNADFTIEADELAANFPGLQPLLCITEEQQYSLLIAKKPCLRGA